MHRSERLENCISHHFSIFPVLGAGSGGSERAGQGRRFCRVAAKAAAVPSLRSRGLQTRVRRADDHRCCFFGGFYSLPPEYHPRATHSPSKTLPHHPLKGSPLCSKIGTCFQYRCIRTVPFSVMAKTLSFLSQLAKKFYGVGVAN